MTALLRTEMIKAVRRTRTYVIWLGLIALPLFILIAIHARNGRPRGDEGTGLFRLAKQSGLLVPAAVLAVMSAFLLVVVAGTFAGDSVAGDAASGNLRYLLMRPVARGRLLIAKATVAGVLIWVCTILVAVAGLVGGIVLFGAHPVLAPRFNGQVFVFELSERTLLLRDLIATAYVAFGFTALLAMGTFFSTLTDSAAGAVGATIGVYIVSEILDGITQLGTMRYAFPTHYFSSWESMFTDNRYSHDMITGIVVQVVYLVVFGAAALVWFRRKDIRS